jgi:uncharacterized protein (TIGR03067 family)
MRFLVFLYIFICTVSCTASKKIAAGHNFLNGSWVPVQQEIGGKELPAVVFKNQKLVISDSSYTVIAESIDKGIVKYTDDKIDIFGKEGVNAGKHFTAIYKLDSGILTVCYNLAGNSYPEAFETSGRPMYFLSVFKKELIK